MKLHDKDAKHESYTWLILDYVMSWKKYIQNVYDEVEVQWISCAKYDSHVSPLAVKTHCSMALSYIGLFTLFSLQYIMFNSSISFYHMQNTSNIWSLATLFKKHGNDPRKAPNCRCDRKVFAQYSISCQYSIFNTHTQRHINSPKWQDLNTTLQNLQSSNATQKRLRT